MTVAKLTSKGQITIPAKVRKELGLDVGSYMVFEPIDSAYIIRPLESDQLDDLPKLFTYTGPVMSIEDMKKTIAQAAIDAGTEGI